MRVLPVVIAFAVLLVVVVMCAPLGGCATDDLPKPQVQTVTVKVPTPVSCVPANTPHRPTNPATREALKAAPDAGARYALLAQFWATMSAWADAADPVIESCRAAGPAPPR
jgi:hypothetical protein